MPRQTLFVANTWQAASARAKSPWLKKCPASQSCARGTSALVGWCAASAANRATASPVKPACAVAQARSDSARGKAGWFVFAAIHASSCDIAFVQSRARRSAAINANRTSVPCGEPGNFAKNPDNKARARSTSPVLANDWPSNSVLRAAGRPAASIAMSFAKARSAATRSPTRVAASTACCAAGPVSSATTSGTSA